MAQFWSFRKILITFFHQKIILVGVYLSSFCSEMNCFWINVKNAKSCWLPPSKLQNSNFRIKNVSTWGLGCKRDFAFLTIIQNRFTWEQKLVCYLKYFWTYFSFFWNFFEAAKLSKWQAFWVQNTNGHCLLNFWARTFKIWNITQLLKECWYL